LLDERARELTLPASKHQTIGLEFRVAGATGTQVLPVCNERLDDPS